MVEIGDVADGEAQDLDLGELLVGGQGGQQLAQLGEGQVEGLHADPLTRGVGRAVLGRGASPPSLLLPAQRRRVQPGPAPAPALPAAAAASPALPAAATASLGGLRVGDTAAERLGVRAAQGLRVGGRRGGVVGVGSLVRAKHHLGGGGGAFPGQRSREKRVSAPAPPPPAPGEAGGQGQDRGQGHGYGQGHVGPRALLPSPVAASAPLRPARTVGEPGGSGREGSLLLQGALMRAIPGINYDPSFTIPFLAFDGSSNGIDFLPLFPVLASV